MTLLEWISSLGIGFGVSQHLTVPTILLVSNKKPERLFLDSSGSQILDKHILGCPPSQ